VPSALSTTPLLQLRLVGTFGLTRDSVPVSDQELGSRKARLLLKLLAVQRGQLVTVDRIVEVLWGATPPERPAENVATLVSRLRRGLGPDVIEGGRGGSDGNGLAHTDVTENCAEGRFGDAEGDPGDGFAVGESGVEVFGGDRLGKRGAGQTEMGDPGGAAH